MHLFLVRSVTSPAKIILKAGEIWTVWLCWFCRLGEPRFELELAYFETDCGFGLILEILCRAIMIQLIARNYP